MMRCWVAIVADLNEATTVAAYYSMREMAQRTGYFGEVHLNRPVVEDRVFLARYALTHPDTAKSAAALLDANPGFVLLVGTAAEHESVS